MKNSVVPRVVFKFFVLALLSSLGINALADTDTTSSTVVAVAGKVERVELNSKAWVTAHLQDALGEGDQIQTWEGRTTLLMSDESMLKLNRNTHLTLRSVSKSASWSRAAGILGASPTALKSRYQLRRGESWLRNNNKDVDIEIETPTVTASLRGTELNIKIISAELVNITVLEGKTIATNSAGSIEATTGEVIIAALGQAPRKQTLLTPQDSVQWTIRIPNLLEREDWLEQTASPAQSNAVQLIFENLAVQDIALAKQNFSSLELSADDKLNTISGLIKMSEGDISGAQNLFRELAKPEQANLAALRGLSITSLLLNQKEEAIKAAQQSLRLNTSDKTVDWLLLAYAQRANFQLSAAEESLQQGLSEDPNSVISLNNLAVLQFSDDRLNQARASIDTALQLDANDSLAHSTSGFIRLTQGDHLRTEQQFYRAIELDPQNSEAYLGLGLLKMRQGKQTEAHKYINTAIALEPQRSLYLSYWAKMLFQAGRYDKAITVLDSAARLDPRDPTPHFYKSIIQRDRFLAGESIDSLQHAIKLNDNRAVYRSRLLLDQDMASRNINLATIYGALGMNLIAGQKAIESATDDFRNFSAHLFLSSTLSQNGRVFPAGSEILVSGLMLPANANSLSTINDYSTFFEGPEIDSNISVSIGDQSSRAATFSLAGVLPDNNLSYGLIAATGKSDGWRGDNGETLDSFASTIKWQANERDSFRARISYNDISQDGNSFNRFEIDQLPNPDARIETTDLVLDLGYRRELSNHSDWLTNLLYRETEINFTDSVLLLGQPALLIDEITASRRDTIQLQTQFSTRFNSHRLFAGAIYFNGDETIDFTQTSFLSDPSGSRLPATPPIQTLLDQIDAQVNQLFDTRRDLSFYSVYLDDSWSVSDTLTIQSGLYYEDFDNGSTDQSKLNPRLGLVWSPTENDTFRVAGFRYLLPQVQSRLHPTHIGGVFITRNTEEGALVEEIDFVWEHKWLRGLLAINLFDLERENREQFFDQPETISRSQLRGANLGINQQLGNRFGLVASAGISEVRDDFILLQTNRDEVNFVLALNYVAPSGIGASISHTYRNIDFINSSRATESISITDVGLAYTFRDRQAAIGLSISNIFDQEFNWITDAFTPGGREPARRVLATGSWNF